MWLHFVGRHVQSVASLEYDNCCHNQHRSSCGASKGKVDEIPVRQSLNDTLSCDKLLQQNHSESHHSNATIPSLSIFLHSKRTTGRVVEIPLPLRQSCCSADKSSGRWKHSRWQIFLTCSPNSCTSTQRMAGEGSSTAQSPQQREAQCTNFHQMSSHIIG
jgi:hypothetical protein